MNVGALSCAARIEAVTFDFWDTLVVAEPGAARAARRTAILAVLEHHGHGDVTVDELDAAFERAVTAFNSGWVANEQFTAAHGGAHVVSGLGRAFSGVAREELIEAFVEGAGDVEVVLTPNVTEAVTALADAGIRLGIICDVGLSPSSVLRGYLDRHGLLDAFDHWSFSDEVGVYKPDRRIFHHALGGLGGVRPSDAAHVGDLRRTDIAGARGAGMRAIRYRGANADDPSGRDEHPEADVVLDDHADLLAALTTT